MECQKENHHRGEQEVAEVAQSCLRETPFTLVLCGGLLSQ